MTNHVERTIATYDHFAADWVEVANNEAITRWIAESQRWFCDLLPNPRVLVPGCGDGRDSQCLVSQGLQVSSFDLSSGMLAIAQARSDAGAFWQMDLRELDTLEHTYGGIFASGCLYHLTPDEFVEFIAAAATRLDPQGAFYLNMKLGEGVEMRHTPKDTYPGGTLAQQKLQGDRYYAYYCEAELDRILGSHFEIYRKRIMQPHTEEVMEYWLSQK